MAEYNFHRALMQMSGIHYCDREEFLTALAEVSGIAGTCVGNELECMYRRYSEEWSTITPDVPVLPSPDSKLYNDDRKKVSVL